MNEVILPKRNVKIFSRETFTKQTNRIITMLVIILAGMIILLSTVFISMTSTASQKGYELKLLQNENEELKVNNENLRTQLNESKSFENIDDAKKLKEMQEANQKQFITGKKRKN
jgi:cell division protein FtsL